MPTVRIALLALVLAAPALAEDLPPGLDASSLAKLASDTRDRYCADTAADQTTAAFEAVSEVTPVLLDVSRGYDATGEEYLRYWRGILGDCIGQRPRAIDDLTDFILAVDGKPEYQAQVDDARRRLRRMGAPIPERHARQQLPLGDPDAPRVHVGVQGGYHRLGAFDYGTVSLLGAGRIVGPLHVEGAFRGGIGQLWRGEDGEVLEPQTRAFLPSGRVGFVLQFPWAVEPRVGISALIGGNRDGSVGSGVIVGPMLHGGVEIPLPNTPLAIRIRGEIGYLHPLVSAGAGAGPTLRF